MSQAHSVAHISNPRAPAMQRRHARALLLDRDGVINVNYGYVHTPAKTQWVDGIFTLCREAVASGFIPVIVTNQAGIGRGLYSDSQFRAYTEWMFDRFSEQDVNIQCVYYCPHHPVAALGSYRIQCNCRKPEPGMIVSAGDDLGLDLASSVMIGDKISDMRAAGAAGVGYRMLLTDTLDDKVAYDPGIIRVASLDQALRVIRHNPALWTTTEI